MERRTLAVVGLATAGLSQVGYGLLMDGASAWAGFQFAEGAGLLVAALGAARAKRLPGMWLVVGLVLAAVAALPWFTRIAGFTNLGPIASFLNNTGSVVAAVAVLAWVLAAASPTLGWNGLRVGLGLQAVGGLVWVLVDAGQSLWTFAYALAFLGFGAAAALFPSPSPPDAKATTGWLASQS
jgi:hypothetical protein